MNWEISGKHKNGNKGALKMIGGPDTEGGVREAVKGSHPDFTVETVKPLDSTTKPHTAPASDTAGPAKHQRTQA